MPLCAFVTLTGKIDTCEQIARWVGNDGRSGSMAFRNLFLVYDQLSLLGFKDVEIRDDRED